MRSATCCDPDVITGNPDEAVDLYFRQWSIDVTCRDLSLMAATMANNGVNPLTHERALAPAGVEQVLSVMATLRDVRRRRQVAGRGRIAGKSGVGGGVLAVLPAKIGIAVYSPRLDVHGNSVRGVASARALSKELELHFLHVTRASRSSIRANTASSKHRREYDAPRPNKPVLDDVGKLSRVYELHGDLLFTGAESAVREIGSVDEGLEVVVIDVRRVDDASDVAVRMITALQVQLAEQLVLWPSSIRKDCWDNEVRASTPPEEVVEFLRISIPPCSGAKTRCLRCIVRPNGRRRHLDRGPPSSRCSVRRHRSRDSRQSWRLVPMPAARRSPAEVNRRLAST